MQFNGKPVCGYKIVQIASSLKTKPLKQYTIYHKVFYFETPNRNCVWLQPFHLTVELVEEVRAISTGNNSTISPSNYQQVDLSHTKHTHKKKTAELNILSAMKSLLSLQFVANHSGLANQPSGLALHISPQMSIRKGGLTANC